MTSTTGRVAGHPIEPLFLERWSPRAFTGEDMSLETLATMLEAARWAPSAFNSQPWRFPYARGGTPHFDAYLDALIPFNQAWAKEASVLMFAVSTPLFTRPGKTEAQRTGSASFDTGSAFGYLCLQAAKLGWHAHGMGGFDGAKAAAAVNLPPEHTVEAAIAIGRHGDVGSLPDHLKAGETPSGRRPLDEIMIEGRF